MNTRRIITLLLVAGLVTAAGSVTAMAQTDSTATTTASAAGQSATAQQDTNYTRLYIEDRHQHLELKPGESDSVTVTVENGDDESVDLSPQVVVPPRGQPPIETEWVTIEPDDTTLDAGDSREFEITVSVPEDAEIRRYGGMIALTDERTQYPGQPARPVHAVSLNVEVWQEPTIQLTGDRHIHSQVKAGDSFTREITVENTGEEAVPLNPQLQTENRRHHSPYSDRETFDRSWVSIDAASEVGAGESETVTVTVSPPADADRGDYNGEIDLGLKDPARNEHDDHWQEIHLGFQVWTQPEEPFETSFEVSEDTTNATLELQSDRHHRHSSGQASFDVTFVSPAGTEIDAQRVQVTDSGSVSLGDERRRPVVSSEDETYATHGTHQTFTYRLDEPEAGTWSVRIMPEDTTSFEYEIVRNED